MSPFTLGLLVLLTIVAGLAWRFPLHDPGRTGSTQAQRRRAALVASLPLLLAAAAILELLLPAWPSLGVAGRTVSVAAAAVAGGPITVGVLALTQRTLRSPTSGTALQGGRVIGVLERIGVAVSILTGWPEGIAVVMAIKGLGRYPELRAGNGASERFIVGTLASVLWALGCVGVTHL